MTYRQTLDFLYNSLSAFHNIGAGAYKPGLHNIEALEEHLGNPHKKFRSVHIAGTNGKGSTSHMLASVLSAAGYKTGLFTSPHLVDFRERIRIDGEMIPQQDVTDFVENNMEAIERIQPSFFEITTAMAFDHFARGGVDVAVVETGMGGRLDSSNILRPLVSVITNISLDHSEYLGDTIEKIAGEKAGIIKEATPAVIGESAIESKLVFISKAKEAMSPILFADNCYRTVSSAPSSAGQTFVIENLLDGNIFSLECDLSGTYQRKNILTALTTLDVLNGAGGLNISADAVRQGIASAAGSTGLAGRWQVLGTSPLIVCDTGHNEGGIAEVAAQIKAQSYRRLFMVLGFVKEKDLSAILPLLPAEAEYIFTRPSVERGLDADKLAEAAAGYGLKGTVVPSVKEALSVARQKAGPEDMIFIGGSTFVVADILS